jgi:DUF971 family protein
MIKENQIIKIEKVSYLGGYKLKLAFNDKSEQSIDFFPFLSNSLNPLIRKYLDEKIFKAYELDDGDLEWNDYDLCFPIADLYENTIRP